MHTYPSTHFKAIVAIVIAVTIATPLVAAANTNSDLQAALQKQLDDINAKIAQNQTDLVAKQKQRTSLERDVAILDYQIEEAQLEIKQRDLTIAKLKANIEQKAEGIQSLDSNVAAGEDSVGEMLRQTNEIDNTSMAARILGGTMHDFIREIDDFQIIEGDLKQAFATMTTAREDLAARKTALESEQQEQSDLLELQVAQKNSLAQKEKEKQTLVSAAKGQEAAYQTVIAGQQQTAAQIRAELFALRDTSKQVSFGDIYNFAKEASAKTNVRPAVILAILSEETNLGQNIGSCSYHEAMHPTRDVPVFLQLMQQLGLDPETQKVSCKPSYGWGGAMGPAQFIPSTWVQYTDRIGAATGSVPPNPYDPRTAVFATAVLMADNGADAGSPDAERLAALRYFAGWKNASNPAYAFYGNDVMSLVAKFQNDISVISS